MAIDGQVRKIVAEDINFGTSTVTIQKADGTTVTANQVNASHLPTSDGRNIEQIIKGVGYSIDEFADLADVVAKIETQEVTLIIHKPITLSQDLTIPENICLKFIKGGKITVDAGYTLTINGAIEAGLWQIFDGDGVVSGSPKIEAAYPEWFGAVGDGVTDDTEAIQKAIDFISAKTDVLWVIDAGNQNLPKGEVRLRGGAIYVAHNILVPYGVYIRGNNSTLKATQVCDYILKIQGSYTGFYSGANNGISDLNIDGNNLADRGIIIETINWSEYNNVIVERCNIAWTLREVQYSKFSRCYGNNSKVGFYLTKRDASTDLPCVDNTFIECVAKYNTNYGVWIQYGTHNSFFKYDASRNGVVNVLLGGNLVGYIKNFIIVDGGSGYPANSVLPVTITDTTGTGCVAYAVTDANGVVTGVYVLESGENYSSPTVTINGGTTLANLIAEIGDDTGIGDFNGASSTVWRNNVFYSLKCEINKDTFPISGYSIWIRPNFLNTSFYNLTVEFQPSGTERPYSYGKFLRSDYFGTTIVNIGYFTTSLSNPLDSNDFSLFKTTVPQGLTLMLGTAFVNSIPYLSVDGDNNPTDGIKTTIIAQTNGSIRVSRQNTVLPTIYYRNTIRVVGDSDDRIRFYGNGKILWGDGVNAPDVAIYRYSTNILSMGIGDSFRVDGTWDGGHLVLGNYHIWVDSSGNLRIKNGAPTSDTDGVIVGTQA